ncbi:MAG: hypothetical protein ABW321_36210 [Polyangiales bacterium]
MAEVRAGLPSFARWPSWSPWLAFGLVTLVACRGGAEPPAAPAAPAPPAPQSAKVAAQAPPSAAAAKPTPGSIEEALHYDPADPLSNLEAADVLDRGAARSRTPRKPAASRSCGIDQDPRRVWSKPGIAALAAFGGGYVMAGYTRAGEAEQVFVVHITEGGKLEPVATLPLAVPHPGERKVGPGLAAELEHGVTVAYVDGSGTLFMQTPRVGAAHGGGSSTLLARGVDTRFAPAVGFAQRGALIAYTEGSTPMRSHLVRLDPKGDVFATHDVTPPAMGAAAPVFVQGASPPALITADPRNGMSPIARTQLDAEGKPRPADLIAPVGMMTQPPQLAAAEAGFGPYVLYSGLGSAATSAIGMLRLSPKPGAPEAFVKGTAYGELHSAAVALPSGLVVGADAPLTPGKAPKHDLQFAWVDAQGTGPNPLHVAGPSGDATHVSLARGQGGQVGFSFSAPDGVYWGTLRCSP